MKIELETIVKYEFESKMPDVGIYKKTFKIKRKTPKYDCAFVATKAALLGGSMPSNRGDELLIDAIATLSVYIEPCTPAGKPDLSEREWVDQILDNDIIFDLYKRFLDYQETFYQKSEELNEEAPVQA